MVKKRSIKGSQQEEKSSENALIKQIENWGSQKLIEITAYIWEDQAVALEIIQNAERQRRGMAVDQSELVREALDLLINKCLIPIRIRKSSTSKISTK